MWRTIRRGDEMVRRHQLDHRDDQRTCSLNRANFFAAVEIAMMTEIGDYMRDTVEVIHPRRFSIARVESAD